MVLTEGFCSRFEVIKLEATTVLNIPFFLTPKNVSPGYCELFDIVYI